MLGGRSHVPAPAGSVQIMAFLAFSARCGLHRRVFRSVQLFADCGMAEFTLRRRRPVHPGRLQLPGRIRLSHIDPRPRLPALGASWRARGRPGMKTPARVWIGVAAVAAALLALPFVLQLGGTAWVRITNFAILYVFLALGLNIVVGF